MKALFSVIGGLVLVPIASMVSSRPSESVAPAGIEERVATLEILIPQTMSKMLEVERRVKALEERGGNRGGLEALKDEIARTDEWVKQIQKRLDARIDSQETSLSGLEWRIEERLQYASQEIQRVHDAIPGTTQIREAVHGPPTPLRPGWEPRGGVNK